MTLLDAALALEPPPPLTGAVGLGLAGLVVSGVVAIAIEYLRTRRATTEPAEPSSAALALPGLSAGEVEALITAERPRLVEAVALAVLAQIRAHYGDRLTAIERHFGRVETAVVGEGITGRDGIARRVETIEELLRDERQRDRTNPGDHR